MGRLSSSAVTVRALFMAVDDTVPATLGIQRSAVQRPCVPAYLSDP